MHHSNEIPKPITGRTYSLYANEQNSSHFYEQIQEITDTCLQLYPDKNELLKILQKASRSSSFLYKASNGKKNPRLYELLTKLKIISRKLHNRY